MTLDHIIFFGESWKAISQFWYRAARSLL